VLRQDPFANPDQLIARLYAYVAYRVGDGPDAEDITSETFARALRYRDGFDPRRGDAVGWIIGIGRRCIADHFAERRDLGGELPEVAAPGDVADDSVRRIELAQALATLEDRDRELVSLRYGADLSAKQIAELLGLRVNTVEVALHRVLRRLRGVLEPEGGRGASASPSLGSGLTVKT
jgi:RNA polymerase sigma-70 factor (ECF subfamily)